MSFRVIVAAILINALWATNAHGQEVIPVGGSPDHPVTVTVDYPAFVLPEAKMDRCLALARNEPVQVDALQVANTALSVCQMQFRQDDVNQDALVRALKLERKARMTTQASIGLGITVAVLAIGFGAAYGLR